MPKLTVNGTEVEFEPGMTVLQACELAGTEVPRFCYHERLKIAGNCRMCLVQIEGGPPKPAASCAMPAAEGMVVHTNSPMVKKAREGVMEFLLINHPLDCPICDQGGECDLQDQAMTYGCGSSRFEENKRAVKDKYMGPLVKTHMTRCIHCTRCVRFLEDVAGVDELGAVHRGEQMQISTYVERSLTSELSGNIIDLCPVGALTSKPYAFKARPWELRKTETVDVLDAVGSNIRVDSRGNEVMRVLPRLNEEVNEEWISDKTRFSCDGLKVQRLDRPYIKEGKKLREASWEEALTLVADKMKKTAPNLIAGIVGDLADVESMYAMKQLFDSLGVRSLDCRQDGSYSGGERSNYRFNTGIAGIEKADVCILVGTNPRYEAPIINARIRKAVVENGLKVYVVGTDTDFTYPVEHIAENASILEELAKGKHAFSKTLGAAKNPMLVVGNGVFTRTDGAAIAANISELGTDKRFVRDDWNGINILQTAASRVGGLDIGLAPEVDGLDTNQITQAAKDGELKFVYLYGADEVDVSAFKKSFVVYQGHHGDRAAHVADVILPGAAYTEKSGTYVNTEGRVQRGSMAVNPPGQAQEDWSIFQKLAQRVGAPLSYATLAQLRKNLEKEYPHLSVLDELVAEPWQPFGKKESLSKEPLKSSYDNFYLSNPISRASKTMAQCVKDIVEVNKTLEKTSKPKKTKVA
jgi:NADH-quinone oxidoreductase subunit G